MRKGYMDTGFSHGFGDFIFSIFQGIAALFFKAFNDHCFPDLLQHKYAVYSDT